MRGIYLVGTFFISNDLHTLVSFTTQNEKEYIHKIIKYGALDYQQLLLSVNFNRNFNLI